MSYNVMRIATQPPGRGHSIDGATADDWTAAQSLGVPPEDLLCTVWRDAYPLGANPVRHNVHRLAKLPSRDLGYKVERGEEWQGHRTTAAEVGAWARNRNLNCAVNCRTVKALDVDVEEAAVVAKLVAEFEHIAGSPVMVRGRPNSQRVLIPFKVEGIMESCAVIGRAGVVEFLSDGKMFVFAGGHASGVRYVHTKGVIPTLSLAQVTAYQTTVGQALEIEMPFTVCCASIQKEEQCLSD